MRYLGKLIAMILFSYLLPIIYWRKYIYLYYIWHVEISVTEFL
jgi:hypothetical protein